MNRPRNSTKPLRLTGRLAAATTAAAVRIVIAVTCMAPALGALFLTGCAQPRKQTPADLPRHEGAMNPPIIISGNPARDAAAYAASEDRLSEADWKTLEKLGPRPMWEQIAAKRTARKYAARDAKVDAAVAANGGAPAPADTSGGFSPGSSSYGPNGNASGNRASSADGAPAHGTPASGPGPAAPAAPANAAVSPMGPSFCGPTYVPPSTQPTAYPAAPSATRAMGMVPESELPVEIVELPDGKLRIVWVLRSYGGSSVVTAREQGTSRRTITVAAPDLTPLVAVITQNLGQGGTVTPLPKENTLVITCEKAMRASVLDLLTTLDVPPRQVEITAKIFEVSRDFDFQQGTELVLNRLATDGGQSAVSMFSARRFLDAVGTATPAQGSVLRLMQVFSAAGVSVDVSFQLLAEAGMINVVSSPRMTVAVGQTGYMLAGQELPIQSANFVNNVLQTATQYKPVGVQLYVTPQAVGQDRVKLHTISIVSSVSGFTALPTMEGGTGPKNLINPVIDSREAETAVTVDNGSTLVISGLRMIRTTTRENKIPGLGEVPVLGWLFKNHRSQQQSTDLYFFLTPTLL